MDGGIFLGVFLPPSIQPAGWKKKNQTTIIYGKLTCRIRLKWFYRLYFFLITNMLYLPVLCNSFAQSNLCPLFLGPPPAVLAPALCPQLQASCYGGTRAGLLSSHATVNRHCSHTNTHRLSPLYLLNGSRAVNDSSRSQWFLLLCEPMKRETWESFCSHAHHCIEMGLS